MAKDFTGQWLRVRNTIKKDFGIKPELDGILFIIGMQELGRIEESFSKDEKQDLMHVAVCSILAPFGFYQIVGHDEDNWPVWEQIKPLPKFEKPIDQEQFLKEHIIHYFEAHEYI